MKKRIICAVFVILLCLLLPLSVSADGTGGKYIRDNAGVLSGDEEAELEEQAEKASASGCEFYVVTYRSTTSKRSYRGEEFMRENHLSERNSTVILIITLDNGQYFYDMYYYGGAVDRIEDREIDYVLDHPDVYDNLKSGKLAEGADAFLSLAERAYSRRIGIPYGKIIIVSLIVAGIVSFLICLGIRNSYKAKNKKVEYPLEHFAKMQLTTQTDVCIGRFVTHRVIQSGSSSRGGGRSGGGSSHGGGRGHAGGR